MISKSQQILIFWDGGSTRLVSEAYEYPPLWEKRSRLRVQRVGTALGINAPIIVHKLGKGGGVHSIIGTTSK